MFADNITVDHTAGWSPVDSDLQATPGHSAAAARPTPATHTTPGTYTQPEVEYKVKMGQNLSVTK